MALPKLPHISIVDDVSGDEIPFGDTVTWVMFEDQATYGAESMSVLCASSSRHFIIVDIWRRILTNLFGRKVNLVLYTNNFLRPYSNFTSKTVADTVVATHNIQPFDEVILLDEEMDIVVDYIKDLDRRGLIDTRDDVPYLDVGKYNKLGYPWIDLSMNQSQMWFPGVASGAHPSPWGRGRSSKWAMFLSIIHKKYPKGIDILSFSDSTLSENLFDKGINENLICGKRIEKCQLVVPPVYKLSMITPEMSNSVRFVYASAHFWETVHDIRSLINSSKDTLDGIIGRIKSAPIDDSSDFPEEVVAIIMDELCSDIGGLDLLVCKISNHTFDGISPATNALYHFILTEIIGIRL